MTRKRQAALVTMMRAEIRRLGELDADANIA